MKKVLLLGSKPIGYKCFEWLIAHANELQMQIAGILSNDNKRFGAEYSVSALAQQHNIPFIEQPDDMLLMADIDYIISVQYHLILKPAHIAVAKQLAINLHMAPLPEYRGCNQFSFAIYNGDKTFGTTLHRLEAGIDNGAIIAEKRFAIPDNCLVQELYDATEEQSFMLFREQMGHIFSGNYALTPQEELIPTRGTHTYYRKDINKLKQIPANATMPEIARRVRATSMPGFEPPYFQQDGVKYYLLPQQIYQNMIKE